MRPLALALSISISTGDAIYMFSDGFPDQFGGEAGKKLLISMQDQDMLPQCYLLDDEFESWRGPIEQIDDVCVIGVRFRS